MNGMKLLRAESIAQKLDIGLSTVWKLAKQDPTFPRPVAVSAHVPLKVTTWVEHEIDAWLLTRLQERDNCQKEGKGA